MQMGPVKRICVFEHSVMTNFSCACPAIQRGQWSGFLSEGSSWLMLVWASSEGSGETARMAKWKIEISSKKLNSWSELSHFFQLLWIPGMSTSWMASLSSACTHKKLTFLVAPCSTAARKPSTRESTRLACCEKMFCCKWVENGNSCCKTKVPYSSVALLLL